MDFEQEPENMEQALEMIEILKDDNKQKDLQISKLESALKLLQNNQSNV